MTTDQVEFTTDELLADHDDLEPLFANGVRCHGGFDGNGTYVSPRTRFRGAAIDAWEAQRLGRSGVAPLHLPLDTWPPSFPNVEQSTFLLRKGVPGPTISSLTRIGTVEGFGSMMRLLPQPDLQPLFVDDIRGTATDHIRKGLFEAGLAVMGQAHFMPRVLQVKLNEAGDVFIILDDEDLTRHVIMLLSA